MKNKLTIFGIVGVAAGLLTLASLASAQVAPLEVTCNAAVSNNTITWTATAGNGVAPYTYLWSGDASVAGSTSTSITATYQATEPTPRPSRRPTALQASQRQTARGSSTISSGHRPAQTSTLTHEQVNLPPELQIGANGSFLAHDLIVQSVSGNSFTGTVWGVTYTVNVASSTNGSVPQFYLRGGNSGGSFNVSELQDGDQLGISGSVASSSPLIVNATVIRDYSVTTARPMGQDGFGNASFGSGASGQGNGNNNASSGNGNAQGRLNQLLQQLQSLQNMFRNRFGGR